MRACSGVLAVLLACAPPDESVHRSTGVDSLSQPLQVSASVDTACDTVAAFIREALNLDATREDGAFTDARGVQRSGCRFVGSGSFADLINQAGPVAALEQAFARSGWRPDVRYAADGPDGSAAGMRHLEQLCLLYGSWDGGDDADTTSVAPADPRYEILVECSRDVRRNTAAETGVPDSLWQIAAWAGTDRAYAISLSMQYPPYLEGDYDGDGVGDAAVLIEDRTTGKLGIAIVRRGAQRVTILGAGAGGTGPDDLGWITEWERFPRDATAHLTIGDRPSTPLVGDALWVARRDSVSAFYVWDGNRFSYEEHLRN